MHNPSDTKVPVTRAERIEAFREMRDRIDARLQELEVRAIFAAGVPHRVRRP
jgi:hypothetical protein